MENFIINLLDLKQENLEALNLKQVRNKLLVNVTLKRKPHKCPICFHQTDNIKEYKERRYHHGVTYNFDITIIYKQRRYICTTCGKTFSENSQFGNSYTSITPATVINVLNDLKHYSETFSHVAEKYKISTTTVMNIFDNHVQVKRHRLQEILCIDEFYFNRHSKYKYSFMIMGFRNKLIIDVVESRRKQKLYDYFYNIDINERRTVKYICMDMYKPYKDICPIFFQNATLCVDSFHVIKLINEKLNLVRKRIMRKFSKDKKSKNYKLLKYRYKLLLKNGDNIKDDKYFQDRILGYTTTEAGVLECLLSIDDELRKAYNLKEDYRVFNSCSEEEFDYKTYEKVFNSLKDSFKQSKIKEMKEVSKALRNWHKEIMSSFIWFDGRRLSNGCIEGKNTYVKKIINNSNGLYNFERARNRFMYSQNKHESYMISIGSRTIKKPGDMRKSYKKKKK